MSKPSLNDIIGLPLRPPENVRDEMGRWADKFSYEADGVHMVSSTPGTIIFTVETRAQARALRVPAEIAGYKVEIEVRRRLKFR